MADHDVIVALTFARRVFDEEIQARGGKSSRELAIAITHLETAILWAKEDFKSETTVVET